MDLASLDTSIRAAEGAILHLRHPGTRAPLMDERSKEPVTITLLGSDSSECRRIEHAQQVRRLEQSRKSKDLPADPDQIVQDAIEILVALTKGWSHLVLDGQPLGFNSENAKMLYTRFTWIREQADRFVTDRANYLGN